MTEISSRRNSYFGRILTLRFDAARSHAHATDGQENDMVLIPSTRQTLQDTVPKAASLTFGKCHLAHVGELLSAT